MSGSNQREYEICINEDDNNAEFEFHGIHNTNSFTHDKVKEEMTKHPNKKDDNQLLSYMKNVSEIYHFPTSSSSLCGTVKEETNTNSFLFSIVKEEINSFQNSYEINQSNNNETSFNKIIHLFLESHKILTENTNSYPSVEEEIQMNLIKNDNCQLYYTDSFHSTNSSLLDNMKEEIKMDINKNDKNQWDHTDYIIANNNKFNDITFENLNVSTDNAE